MFQTEVPKIIPDFIFKKRTLVFIKPLFSFFQKICRYLFVKFLASGDHSQNFRIVCEIGLVDDVPHEFIFRFVSCNLIVFLQNFWKGAVRHNRKGLQQQEIFVQSIDRLCHESPLFLNHDRIWLPHDLHTFPYPFLSNCKFLCCSIKEMRCLSKFGMEQFEKSNFSRRFPYRFRHILRIILFGSRGRRTSCVVTWRFFVLRSLPSFIPVVLNVGRRWRPARIWTNLVISTICVRYKWWQLFD